MKEAWQFFPESRGVDRPSSSPPPLIAHHISMGVEYSVDPSSTSGGLYHRVTTSLE